MAPRGRFVAALLILAGIAGPSPAPHAQAAAPLAVAAFDFRDTSGEPRDQTAEHAARLKLFDAALREELARHARIRPLALACRVELCSARNAGLEAVLAQAKAAQAHFLMIGEFHKISTLIGALKLAVYDLGDGRVTCDRSLSYRGDTDEAFLRAARFAAREIAERCIPR